MKPIALIAVVIMSVGAVRCALCIADDAKKAASPLDAIKALDGAWESDKPGPDGKPQVVLFHVTAANSVVVETMFPGTDHEMMNAYHMDGEKLIMTHYCAQGVQPRLKLAGTDGGALKFDFLDCTNLKDGEGCMGGLEMNVSGDKGDKLVEKWFYRTDGKLGDPHTFEFHKKT